MPEETLRLFIALPVPEPLRIVLSDWCSRSNTKLPFQSWVHKDDYHITLKFLGDSPSSRLPEISDSLAPSLKSSSPFSLAADSLGVFGPEQSPRILWAGLTGDLQALGNMQRQAESAMCRIGFTKEDQAYRPHITLARRYRGTSPFRIEGIADTLLPLLTRTGWQVDRVVLYRTHLKRKPMYESLESYPIGGNQN